MKKKNIYNGYSNSELLEYVNSKHYYPNPCSEITLPNSSSQTFIERTDESELDNELDNRLLLM